MHELRKFRHFFRNAYVLDLNPALVQQRTDDLSRADGPIAAGLADQQAHIAANLAELRGTPAPK